MLAAATAEHARLVRLITGLRNLARADLADPGWFAPCDLGDVAADAIADAAGAGQEVLLRAPDTLVIVAWADGLRLAVANLVANALRHAALPGRAPEVHVAVERDGDEASVTVDDDGQGIAPHRRVRVVEPFERGGGAAAGTGLGLAIADQQARLHGGRMLIDDSPLGGARVRIVLPLQLSPTGRPRSSGCRAGWRRP